MRPPAFASPPTMTQPPSTPPPLLPRVLCLHGYRQSGATFRAKTGALRKRLRPHAELDYLDAPHAADGGRAWWRASDDGSAYAGLDASVALVRSHLADHGPYAGVLGFSQGATFASLLAGLAGAEEAGALAQLRFAVLASGFASRADAHKDAGWYADIHLRSLHVWGEADERVPKAASEALARRFRTPETIAHAGGHVLPAGDALRQVASFIVRHSSCAADALPGVRGRM